MWWLRSSVCDVIYWVLHMHSQIGAGLFQSLYLLRLLRARSVWLLKPSLVSIMWSLLHCVSFTSAEPGCCFKVAISQHGLAKAVYVGGSG